MSDTMHDSPSVAVSLMVGIGAVALNFLTPFPPHLPPDMVGLLKTCLFAAIGGTVSFFVQRAWRRIFPDSRYARLSFTARLRRLLDRQK